jgi:hypothetical protein
MVYAGRGMDNPIRMTVRLLMLLCVEA